MIKKKTTKIFYIIILHMILFAAHYTAATPKNLPVPRFVTIKFNEVNSRSGPTIDCPVEWVFTKKGEPVEIIAEYENWRKIRDLDNEGGWVHLSVLSGKRAVIIKSDKKIVNLISTKENYESVIAHLEPNVRCDLLKCQKEWCQINCQNNKGWVNRKYIWGVYPEE